MSWKDKDPKDPKQTTGEYGLTTEPHTPTTIAQPHTLQGAAGVGPQGAPHTPGAYPGSQGYVEGPVTHTPVLDAPAEPPTTPTPDLRPAPPIWFQTWRMHTHVPLADQEVADLVDYVGKLEVADRTLLNRLSAGLGSGLVGSI